MADVTPRLGLTKPEGPDQITTLSVGPHDLRDAIDVLDTAVVYGESLHAARPSPGVGGRLWRSTDTGEIALDTGAAWLRLAFTPVPVEDVSVEARVPTGAVMPFAGASAPQGWLLCDGSAVSRATYAGLFAIVGTAYGAGNGSTTFNLPDLRGRVAVGAGAGTGLTSRARGDQVGAEGLPSHSHTMSAHTHTLSAHTHSRGTLTVSSARAFPDASGLGGVPQSLWQWQFVGVASGTGHALSNAGSDVRNTGLAEFHTHDLTGDTGSGGGGATGSGGGGSTGSTGSGSHGVMQPSLVLTSIIKT